MQSTISDRTFRAAQALSIEGRWARSYLQLFESAATRALTDCANRLYVIGEFRQAAELLTERDPADHSECSRDCKALRKRGGFEAQG
jgi:hypothetical protein